MDSGDRPASRARVDTAIKRETAKRGCVNSLCPLFFPSLFFKFVMSPFPFPLFFVDQEQGHNRPRYHKSWGSGFFSACRATRPSNKFRREQHLRQLSIIKPEPFY